MELINKTALIDNLIGLKETCDQIGTGGQIRLDTFIKAVEEIPAVEEYPRWIPCSERLPKDLEVVNITWTNRKPAPYYASIKDKPFTATAVYYSNKWYWYSCYCEGYYLGEYGDCESDVVDENIEIIAWMPLPEPYEEE